MFQQYVFLVEIGIPIHFHTHDTSGIAASTILAASEAGVYAVDTAMDAFSGGTSKPCLVSIGEALRHTNRDTGLDIEDVRQELITVTEEAGWSYLGRRLNALGTIGVLSPLMGLLGTIVGMIAAFDAIAQAGAGDTAAVAAGISQALITTASGLIVAIPTIVFHRFLSARAEKAFKEIELYCHAFANTLILRMSERTNN